MLRKKTIIACCIAALTFIVFLPALRNGFVNWDDNDYVVKNLFIQSFDSRLLTSAFAGFSAANWHPLTWLSHAVDYSFWGLNPFGHHLTNNVLHAVNTLIVVLLVTQLLEFSRKGRRQNGSSPGFLTDRSLLITGAAVGLLFGLHPLHVESVAWVSERKDLLCALFFLLAVRCYARYAADAGMGKAATITSALRHKQYLLALALLVLALLSKPMAVSLPFVLLILDWQVFKRINSPKTFWTALTEKIPFLAVVAASSIVTILAQRAGGAMASVEIVPMSMRVLVAAASLIGYLAKMLLPLDLVPFYPYPTHASLFSVEYGLPAVLVVAITTACIIAARNRSAWLSLWGYYVVTLLPVLGIVQVGDQAMADRYTYLPSLGPFVAIGLAAAWIDGLVTEQDRRRGIKRAVFSAVSIMLVLALSYATIQQTGVWKSGIALWTYVSEQEPSLALARDNLGDAYASAGQTDRAAQQYQAALKVNPSYAPSYNNMGAHFLESKRYDEAIEQFKTAIRLKPDFALAHYNLGYAYYFKGQLDTAIEEYERSLRLEPDVAFVHLDLANAFYTKGQFNRAIEHYLASIRLDPNSPNAYYNLGNAYMSQDRFDPAIEAFQMAVSLKPDFVDAHYNLGLAYQKKGMLAGARSAFERVLALKPDDDEARNMLNSIAGN